MAGVGRVGKHAHKQPLAGHAASCLWKWLVVFRVGWYSGLDCALSNNYHRLRWEQRFCPG